MVSGIRKAFRGLVDGVCRLKPGFRRRRSKAGTGRAVRFQSKAVVFEFERQLFGGGGVPDADAVSLGLGPRLICSYESPLGEKQDKDEYACTGFLDTSERTQLLREWSSQPLLKRQLTQHVAPIVERTRRERSESASSRKDQRRMPATEEEALQMALQDAMAARRAAKGEASMPRSLSRKQAVTHRRGRAKPE